MPDLTSDLSNKYVIGVDYGTLSGRALLVRVSDGAEIATAKTVTKALKWFFKNLKLPRIIEIPGRLSEDWCASSS